MSVTRNLESALHHVRRHWTRAEPGRDPSSFRLWADAICVNQNDLEERMHTLVISPAQISYDV
jgi:hypothetical protein